MLLPPAPGLLALDATLPGIYINAEVGRAMVNGLAAIQSLAARHQLRRYVVVGLGTNGPVSAAQIRQLRHLIGPNRDLILINTFGPMPWESSVNTVLDEDVVRHIVPPLKQAGARGIVEYPLNKIID